MSQLLQVSEFDQRYCWYSLEIYILYFLLLPFLWNPPSKLANLQTEDLEGPGFNRRNKLYYGGSTLNVHLYSVLYLKIQWKAFFFSLYSNPSCSSSSGVWFPGRSLCKRNAEIFDTEGSLQYCSGISMPRKKNVGWLLKPQYQYNTNIKPLQYHTISSTLNWVFTF